MKCRYCNIALAPLRTLTDGEFCCDEHRHAYTERGAPQDFATPPPEGRLVALHARVESASPDSLLSQVTPPAPFGFRPEATVAPKFSALPQSPNATAWPR